MPTILIVEDDADLLFLYRASLINRGCDVLEARSNSEVMHVLQTTDPAPDLIIMDIGMPDAPGTRAIEYLKSDARFDKTRIVVITANDHYRERVQELGVDEFLVKPIAIAQLIELAEDLTN